MARDVSALILAGGRATRMGGRAKHELIVDGATIFARQCAVLAPRVAEILVSSPTAIAGYRCVADAIDGGVGPLAGIAAGLAAVATPWLIVIAGDMPYVCGAIIDALLAKRAADIDAVGVRVDGVPEPLIAVLARDCGTIVARMLAAGRYKASHLLTDEGLRVAWLEDAELRAIDPELRALRNVNAPADLDGNV